MGYFLVILSLIFIFLFSLFLVGAETSLDETDSDEEQIKFIMDYHNKNKGLKGDEV